MCLIAATITLYTRKDGELMIGRDCELSYLNDQDLSL